MRLLTLLIGFLALAPGAAAQADWPVIERCISEFNYPSIPPSQWDFEGKIITIGQLGMRVIQAAEPQQYFIALSSGNSFPDTGALSPDGKWFAYLAGHMGRTSMMWNTYFVIDQIIIVPVDGTGDAVYMPWRYYGSVSFAGSLPEPLWLSSHSIAIQTNDKWYEVDLTRPTELVEIEPPPFPDQSLAVSPNGRYRAYEAENAAGQRTLYYADIQAEQIYDLCLVRRATWSVWQPWAWSPDSTTLAFTFDGFPVLLNVETMTHQILRYETGEIFAWLPPPPAQKADGD